MKQYKKALAVLLAAGLVISLAACSGKADTDTATDTAEASQEAVTKSSEAVPETPPEMPEGETPPEGMPGEQGMPGGTLPEGETPPEPPEGGMPGGQGFPGGNGQQGPGGRPGEQGFPGGNPPDGSFPEGETPPEPPEGGMPGGQGFPGGNGQQGPGGRPDGQGGPGGMPGGNSASVDYSAAEELASAETQSGQTYVSSKSDESALIIATSDAVTVENATVTKTGDSDGGDACSFYGLNAAVLVKDGAAAEITGGTVTSDAKGANAVFCYGGNGGRNGAGGDGTTLTVKNTVIRTSGDGSGGIMTTGGGITLAENLDVVTEGRSSAAIRTDRGGGTVWVTGGTYETNGLGSPVIYSTAEIHVNGAKLTSNLSEGICIEGLNAVELTDCELTANNTKCNGNATFLDSIMIYQSMSGDAASGTSHFTMTGGTLTSKSGHVFHVTNTSAVITLSGATIVNEDSENVLISVCDDGWSGAGNKAELNASGQKLSGAVLVGDNSELSLNLTNGSSFEGFVDGKVTNAKGETVSTEAGTVSVTLDESSSWTLTADSYITEFNGSAANVVSSGFTLYVNGTPLAGTK